MGVLRAYHAALGELIFEYEGTLERFAGDGLMVFFNDPVPCDDRAAARGPDGGRDAGASRRAGREWHKHGPRPPASGSGIARATRRSAGSASRGASTTPRSARSRTSPRASATRRRAGQILVSQRVLAATEEAVTASAVEDLALKGFSKPVRVFSVVGLEDAYAGASATSDDTSAAPGLAELSEEQRSRALRGAPAAARPRSGARCAPAGRGNRSSSCRRGRSTSRTSRPPSPRPTRSGCSFCCCCCASRACASST